MSRATSTHGCRSTINWFGAYTTAVFLVSALLYKHLFAAMAVVPVVSELLLVKLANATDGYWKSFLWRIIGLVTGNLLLHYFYVLPVIYKGDEPWSEEILMRLLISGVQIIIAAFVLLVAILVRKTDTTNPR